MARVVVRVVARHDAAHDFISAARQKQRRVTVQIKRVPFTIEKRFALNNERRHPGGIVFVNSPRKLDKRGAIFARRD